jgi:hypothetical protein
MTKTRSSDLLAFLDLAQINPFRGVSFRYSDFEFCFDIRASDFGFAFEFEVLIGE